MEARAGRIYLKLQLFESSGVEPTGKLGARSVFQKNGKKAISLFKCTFFFKCLEYCIVLTTKAGKNTLLSALSVVRYKNIGERKWAKAERYEHWCLAMVAVFIEMKRTRDNYSYSDHEKGVDGDEYVKNSNAWFHECDPRVVGAWVALELSMMESIAEVAAVAEEHGPHTLALKVTAEEIKCRAANMTAVKAKCFNDVLYPTLDRDANASFLLANVRRARRDLRGRAASVAAAGPTAGGELIDDMGAESNDVSTEEGLQAWIATTAACEKFDEDLNWEPNDFDLDGISDDEEDDDDKQKKIFQSGQEVEIEVVGVGADACGGQPPRKRQRSRSTSVSAASLAGARANKKKSNGANKSGRRKRSESILSDAGASAHEAPRRGVGRKGKKSNNKSVGARRSASVMSNNSHAAEERRRDARIKKKVESRKKAAAELRKRLASRSAARPKQKRNYVFETEQECEKLARISLEELEDIAVEQVHDAFAKAKQSTRLVTTGDDEEEEDRLVYDAKVKAHADLLDRFKRYVIGEAERHAEYDRMQEELAKEKSKCRRGGGCVRSQ